MVMILSLLLYLYEAVLKKYKFHAYFYTSALIFYFTKKADKMQVLFIKKSNKTAKRIIPSIFIKQLSAGLQLLKIQRNAHEIVPHLKQILGIQI